jgi:hypothetical protein
MASVFMIDRSTGRACLFTENGTSGDPADPNSTRNLPLNNPVTYLDKVKFHSDLDHFEVAFAGSIGVTHASIAGIGAASRFSNAYGTAAGSDDNLLLTHSLGYVPLFLVANGSNILWPGMPVQNNSDGGARYASAYADTSVLRLFTQATIGATTLASVTNTYSYLVFKNPPAGSGSILMDFDPATGITTMGLGKFHSDAPYLQIVPGGSPLGLSNGRTIDLNNGAPKAWRPDGTTLAPVPSGLSAYLQHISYTTDSGSTYGSSMVYGGSYGGPTSIQVQAP